MTENSSIADHGLYPIRTVSSLTGVHPVTLRAWERRYSLIKPQRTPKGHRLYTDADINVIKQVLELLNQGVSVSQAKRVINEAGASFPTTEQETSDPWTEYQERMLTAINAFDELALDSLYNDILSLYPIDVVSVRLISPLLKHLGSTWSEDELGIAKEHFLTTYLRNKLGTRFHHLNTRGNGPKLLAACLPGEYHEIGLLQFCLSAVSHGYRIVLLGANVPLNQLIAPAERANCRAIVLSGSSGPKRKLFSEDLPNLVRFASVPVFIGGTSAEKSAEVIAEAGAIPIGTDPQNAIQTISQTLAN